MKTALQTGAGKGTAFILLSVLLLMIARPQLALAHASLVQARPAPGAVVATAPTQIELWFNELLEDGFNSVMVISATEVNLPPGAQHNFARGTPMLVPGDNTHLRIAVAPLPQGIYAVEWRVLSRDGHSAPGQFNFRVIDGRKLSS